VNSEQFEKIRSGLGFFAALDQSGGSTPGALAEYGIPKDRYNSDAEMFDLVHAMRTRVITSPAFDHRILAAILFVQTMERDIDGLPSAQYLWERKNIVPFLKVDLGLADVANDVQLMKPITTLDDVLGQAQQHHRIFGTKMRSFITDSNEAGIGAIVDQQFEYADRIRAAGFVPIMEPEVSIKSPHKKQAETMLRDAIHQRLDALPEDAVVMFKITIPDEPGLYGSVASDPRVLRVLALSGGYSRDEACALLVRDATLTPSFSRALLAGLTAEQTDEQFNAELEASVAEIYKASLH
jgi:fructose-bisphosphate aldolase class I